MFSTEFEGSFAVISSNVSPDPSETITCNLLFTPSKTHTHTRAHAHTHNFHGSFHTEQLWKPVEQFLTLLSFLICSLMRTITP